MRKEFPERIGAENRFYKTEKRMGVGNWEAMGIDGYLKKFASEGI